MEGISAIECNQACQAQKYRLQKINEIQTILTDEVVKRTISDDTNRRSSEKNHTQQEIPQVGKYNWWS